MSALSDLAHGYPAEGLVPGDANGVAALGVALANYADLLADAARALARIEVEWDGTAAGRFREEFGLQPGRFSAAAGCFEEAATALGRYAATLASAQLAAVRARDLFAEGMRAAVAAAGGLLGVDAGPLDLLLTPAGREQRLAAVELLERVRADVDRAGNQTAEGLRNAMAATPEPTPAWQHAMNFAMAPPWDINQERRDWAAGAVVGILETLVLASAPLPIALWFVASTKPQVNAFEWRLGGDPRSGFHTAGAIVVPGILTGAAGLEGAASKSAIGMATDSLAGKPSNPVPEFLFRGGSRTDANMTPRPVDTTGLSTFDSVDHPFFRPGERVQMIEPARFKTLTAFQEGQPGHWSISPPDRADIAGWASTRDAAEVHPLTRELIESVLKTVKKPK